MDRVRRLAELWNWLPAFRVVAETRHLPSASKELHVSAPALSRTIKLLEDRVGQPLFRRVHRRLELNEAGEHLLSALRDAMRGLDDGLNALTATSYVGPFRISTHSAVADDLVLPVLGPLVEQYPLLTPHVLKVELAQTNSRLRDGSLDFALVSTPITHRDLKVEHLADIPHALYCGASHPLHRQQRPTREQLQEHAFVIPLEGLDDPWPPDWPRRAGIGAATVGQAIELCKTGQALAVLPRRVADPLVRARSLRRLPLELPRPTSLYAVYRRPIAKSGPPQVLAQLVEATVSAAHS